MNGSDVFATIRSQVRQAEGRHRGLQAELEATEAEIARLTAERNGAYLRLAQVYLPELGEQALARVEGRFPEIHGRLEEILAEKRAERQRLEADRGRLEKERGEVEAALAEITGRLEAKVQERERLRAAVDEELTENAGYQDLLDRAMAANERLEQDRRRLEAAEKERDEKVPAYRANRLFTYLLERGYDNPAYQPWPIFAALDGWVAGLVDYSEQKRNFDTLQAIPEVMEKEVARGEEELSRRADAWQSVADEAAERHGLTAALQACRELYGEREQRVSRLEAIDGEHRGILARLVELDGDSGAYHERALGEYASFLGSEDLERLRAAARSTPERDDDGLVALIEELGSKIEGAGEKARRLRAERDLFSGKLDGLKRIERDFTRQDFDSSRSRFPGDFDIASLLAAFLLGRHSSESIRRTITEKQWFKPVSRPVHTSRGSSWSFPSSGSGGFGGGFGGGSSGGGFSTGGGFGGGGGGFSTGGGFGGGGGGGGGFRTGGGF